LDSALKNKDIENHGSARPNKRADSFDRQCENTNRMGIVYVGGAND